MRSIRRTGARSAALAAVAALALTACGSGDDEQGGSEAAEPAGQQQEDDTAGETGAEEGTATGDADPDAGETDDAATDEAGTEADEAEEAEATESAGLGEDDEPALRAITVEEGEEADTIRLEFAEEVPAFWHDVVSEVTHGGEGTDLEVEGDWLLSFKFTNQGFAHPDPEIDGLNDLVVDAKASSVFEGENTVGIGLSGHGFEGQKLPEYVFSKDGSTMVIEVARENDGPREPTEL